MTAAVKPLPDHGTTARFWRDCKQPCCRDAYNAARRETYRTSGRTRPEPNVDAQPVREHLRHLMAHRVGYRLISELSGVPVKTIKSILYGHRSGVPLKTVQARTARQLLAVQVPAPLDAPDRKKVDATVTRRQMQALTRRGHSCALVAEAVGAAPKVVRGWLHNDLIEARWARAVAELYARWHDSDAEQHGATPAAATLTRAWARRAGHILSEAWRDINNPGEEQPDGHGPDLRSPEDIAEDAEFIRATTGQSWELVAERLGVNADTLHRYLSGAKTKELAA